DRTREREPRLGGRAVERSDHRDADHLFDAKQMLGVAVGAVHVVSLGGELREHVREPAVERIDMADALLAYQRDLLFEQRMEDDRGGTGVLQPLHIVTV